MRGTALWRPTTCLRARPPRACSSLASASAASPPTSPTLSRLAVVLCSPAGPANVGACARALQCFGLSDLRLVTPGNFVIDREADGAPFREEALEYAVSARPLLEASTRHASAAAACHDAQLVLATSARNRDSCELRLLTPRAAAAEAAAVAARGGRVALLFGSERTGLANSDIALAHALVCVPTAAGGAPASGAGGRYSLNLSHAVSIVAYELHQAMAAAAEAEPSPASAEAEPGESDWALDTAARARLLQDLSAACRALQLLPADAEAAGGAAAEAEAAAEASELRALARAVSGPLLSARAASPLFHLSRRVAALAQMAGGAPLDEPVLARARAALGGAAAGGAEARAALQRAFRDAGLNLSRRELERLVTRLEQEASPLAHR